MRHLDVAEILLQKGADINARDNRGISPLQHATSSGHAEVIEFLIAKGAIEDKGRLSM